MLPKLVTKVDSKVEATSLAMAAISGDSAMVNLVEVPKDYVGHELLVEFNDGASTVRMLATPIGDWDSNLCAMLLEPLGEEGTQKLCDFVREVEGERISAPALVDAGVNEVASDKGKDASSDAEDNEESAVEAKAVESTPVSSIPQAVSSRPSMPSPSSGRYSSLVPPRDAAGAPRSSRGRRRPSADGPTSEPSSDSMVSDDGPTSSPTSAKPPSSGRYVSVVPRARRKRKRKSDAEPPTPRSTIPDNELSEGPDTWPEMESDAPSTPRDSSSEKQAAADSAAEVRLSDMASLMQEDLPAGDEDQGPPSIRGGYLVQAPTLAEGAEPPPPLSSKDSGFVEFAAAMAALLAHTSYYRGEHPESLKSLEKMAAVTAQPLKNRGEIAFFRSEENRHAIELLVQTGTRERYDSDELLGSTRLSGLGTKLTDVFERRRLVAVVLREGIPKHELSEVMELLAGPEISADELRNDYHQRRLEFVTLLFAQDLLGNERGLPWQVDVALSRFARELLSIERREVRDVDTTVVRCAADVVRGLAPPAMLQVLTNLDLVSEQVSHLAWTQGLVFDRLVVEAVAPKPSLLLARATLDAVEAATRRGRDVADQHRRILDLIGERFVRSRTIESDDVLRELHERAILSFPQLPADLRAWILAEKLATQLADDVSPALKQLEQEHDLVKYGSEIDALQRAMCVLARRAEVLPLKSLVEALRNQAGDARPGGGSRAEHCARTLRSLDDQELMLPIAEKHLVADRNSSDVALELLLQAPRAAAVVLCEARGFDERSKSERARFVSAMSELRIETSKVPDAIFKQLQKLDPDIERHEQTAEDLLRAVRKFEHNGLGEEARRFVNHSNVPVRRSALVALTRLLGEEAGGELKRGLSDADERVQLVAIRGLREVDAVDPEVVTRLVALLDDTDTDDERKAAAVVALGRAKGDGRGPAAIALTHILNPRSRGLLNRFLTATTKPEHPLVLEGAARSLLRIGGSRGRSTVEAFFAKSKEPLRRRIEAVLLEKSSS